MLKFILNLNFKNSEYQISISKIGSQTKILLNIEVFRLKLIVFHKILYFKWLSFLSQQI